MVNRVGHTSCYKGNYNKKLNTEILKRAALVKGLSINRRLASARTISGTLLQVILVYMCSIR